MVAVDPGEDLAHAAHEALADPAVGEVLAQHSVLGLAPAIRARPQKR